MNHYIVAGLIGLVSGITSGLFGVGGGIVMVPAMMLLLGVAVTQHAVGTSLAVIIPTAIVGTFQHHRYGNVEWRTFALLAPTAILGGVIGSKLATVIPSADLKRAFGAFLVLVGVKLLFFK